MKFKTLTKKNKFSSFLPIIVALLILTSFSTIQAQYYIGGTSSTNVGSSGVYFINGGSVSSTSWSVQPSSTATITPQGNSQASITFSAPGTYAVSAVVNGSISTSDYQVIVSYPPPAIPNDPTVESITCGQAILQRPGIPPSGVRWYWQGKNSNGFNVNLGYRSTYTANESGTYYLRARNLSTGVWSTGSASVGVSINSSTATPNVVVDVPTVCSGNSTFMTASGVSGATYNWYNASNSYLGSGSTFGTGNLTTNTTFQVSATVNGCEGPKRSVTVTVAGPPQVYSLTNNGPAQVCNGNTNGSVRLVSSQSGVNYQLLKDNIPIGNPMGGNDNSSITWNGLSFGTYSVEASYASGICNVVPMQNQVTINQASSGSLIISLSSGDKDNVCPNTQVQLFVSGTNIDPNSTYTWTDSLNGTPSTGTTNSVTLSPGSSIQYTVSATDLCGDTITEIISLRAQENMGNLNISGPDTRCEGPGGDDYNVSVSNSSELGTLTYLWSIDTPSAVQSLNQSTGELVWNPTFIGDVTLSVNVDSGCENKNQSMAISVTPKIAYYEDKDRDGYYIDIVYDCDNPDVLKYVLFHQTIGPDDCDDEKYEVNPGTTWYLNVDGDNHAAVVGSATGCTPPNDNYTDYQYEEIPEDDCDDNDPAVGGPKNWYLDVDGDRYPASDIPVVSCTKPSDDHFYGGFFAVDCNDGDDTITSTVWYEDLDGDGLGGEPEGRKEWACSVYDLDNTVNWVDNNDDYCPNDINNTCDNYPCTETFEDEVLVGENYVYSRTYQYKSPDIVDPQRFVQNDTLVQEITYFDGLGRQIQQIGIAQTPALNDIVTPMEYDGLGRMEIEWLPYPTTDNEVATLRKRTKTAIEEYYLTPKYENTTNPFSQKKFENSPLSRVEQQAAPGNDWAMGNGHEIEFAYELNSALDGVKQFRVTTIFTNNTYTPTLIQVTDYTDGELYKNITRDENHDGTTTKDHTTEEFTDKQGKVVLKRTHNNNEAHDTYYVYDDFGNLTYVLPPLVDTSTTVDQTVLDNLCYQYVYDHRNRLVEKQLPGKGREYIVYDKRDQPIMTQDSIQRTTGEWLFTKYDAFGRVAYTGKAVETTGGNPTSRVDVQSNANSVSGGLWVQTNTGFSMDNITVGYGNTAYPSSTVTEVLTVNYYDDYSFSPITGNSVSSFGVGSTVNAKGLATGSRVKVLGTTDWITTATYYDEKARPIYTHSENDYLGTVDIVESELDFVGKPLRVRSSHTRNSVTVATLDNFAYDHVGRLLKQTQCIGNENLGYSCAQVDDDLVVDDPSITTDRTAPKSLTIKPANPGDVIVVSGTLTLKVDATLGGTGGTEELIAYNQYDELGQLVQKKVGGSPGADYAGTQGLQVVDYAYNVRGWLKSINEDATADNDLFNFGINYNTVAHGGTPLYNGNIAETQWETANDNQQRWYRYTYDALNRITGGTSSNTDYSLGLVSYDKNGNITRLTRNGHRDIAASTFGLMDDLTYSYTGNQLQAVDDDPLASDVTGFVDPVQQTTEYTYDTNGNMKTDANKGITAITYNHLNLPTSISINPGTISYIYDAAGAKLQKTATEGSSVTTEYAGNFVYEGGTLQFFNTPEGYVTPDGLGGYDYVYQYKDHLGNVRLSYVDNNGTVEIVEENNYYPFGLKHKGYNEGTSPLGNDVANRWKFGGKELDNSFNDALATYDFGARNYDPSLGRWMNLDPLAEQMRRHSPYNYAFDNPVFFIDPDGMMPIPTQTLVQVSQTIEDIAYVQEVSTDNIGVVALDGVDVSPSPNSRCPCALHSGQRSLSKFFTKLSGGEGSGGFDFYSTEGDGQETRKGDMKTELMNGDVILNAATAAGTSNTPLNKNKVPDLESISTVATGMEKGGAAAEATMDTNSGSLGTSNNVEPNSGNEMVSIQLHTRHPDFGYVNGQVFDTGRTSFRDSTVTISTAEGILKTNDSIQREKIREARRKFVNKRN